MGKIKIGKLEYSTNCFSLVGSRLSFDGGEVLIGDEYDLVQLRGTYVNIKRLITNSETILEGIVDKSFSKGSICAVDRVISSYTYSKERYYNGTANEEYRKAVNYFNSKPKLQPRVVVKIEGAFDKVYISGNIEVKCKGTVNDVFCSKDLLMKGLIKSAVCEGKMYISK